MGKNIRNTGHKEKETDQNEKEERRDLSTRLSVNVKLAYTVASIVVTLESSQAFCALLFIYRKNQL